MKDLRFKYEIALKGAMSPHTHARANENKLEQDATERTPRRGCGTD